jgi:predicted  nucleic acid-binding Zn-ribbon protein
MIEIQALAREIRELKRAADSLDDKIQDASDRLDTLTGKLESAKKAKKSSLDPFADES